MTGPNVAAAPEDADLHELGIGATDEDLLEAARMEPAIATEAEALRAKAKSTPSRLRAGPLAPEERGILVGEATGQLRRALLALLVAVDTPVEVHRALALVHLELRRYPPGLDGLAGALQRDL